MIFILCKLKVLEFVFRACEMNLLYLFKIFIETMRALNPKSSKQNMEMEILTWSLGFCNWSSKGNAGESKHWCNCSEIANVGSALLCLSGGGLSVGRHLPQINPCSPSLCFAEMEREGAPSPSY